MAGAHSPVQARSIRYYARFTRYNRFKNYLSDTCLRARLFATRGEFQPVLLLNRKQ